MNKGTLVVLPLVLFLSFFGKAVAENKPPIAICLVENEMYHRHVPPAKIIIGVEVQSDAFYKLSSKEGPIQGGLLRKGFNPLSISSLALFDETGSHLFEMELKRDGILEKKEITIEIRLLPMYVVQRRGEMKKKHEFTLSLFIGDQLIYATRKFSLQDISFKIDLPLSDGKYNPFGLIKGTQKPINTVSVLDAVAGIYQLARSLAPKKEEEDDGKPIQKKQRIETTFVKRDALGDLWEWKALISIKTKEGER
jgi:hypothetical protein